MSLGGDTIRSSRFRTEREADWRRLAGIVDVAERRGLSTLDFRDARDLVMLYRQAVNSLSVARAISLDAAVVAYLESLCARAYLVVYAPRDSLRGIARRFFAVGAPRAVRRSALSIALAFALMAFGAGVAYSLTMADPTWFYAFVPGDLAGGRGPRASTETLRAMLYDGDTMGLDGLSAFAAYLFSHNTQIALFSFALGIVVCVPSGLLVVYNGAVLGAFAAVHAERGLALDLFGWISIHGVTELSAIAIATAGGMRLGLAVLFPGLSSRSDALRHAGRDAVKLAVTAAVMLLAAGLLEAFGRQLVTDLWTRVAIGWGIGLLWLAWFLFAGRRAGDTAGPPSRGGDV